MKVKKKKKKKKKKMKMKMMMKNTCTFRRSYLDIDHFLGRSIARICYHQISPFG